jgi:hypothetical protein
MVEMPPALGGRSAWHGPEIADRSDWIEPLSPAELAEIELAGRSLAQAEPDWQTLRADDFPLPTLSRRLAQIRDEVLEGRGFVVLRGLPVEHWGRRFSALAFLGLGLHFGSLRSQNRHGHLLGHEKARPLPPVFVERYGSVVPGQRGGISVPGMRYKVPWEAEVAPGAS